MKSDASHAPLQFNMYQTGANMNSNASDFFIQQPESVTASDDENTITTTTGVGINVKAKMNFTGGVDGAPVAMQFFLQR